MPAYTLIDYWNCDFSGWLPHIESTFSQSLGTVFGLETLIHSESIILSPLFDVLFSTIILIYFSSEFLFILEPFLLTLTLQNPPAFLGMLYEDGKNKTPLGKPWDMDSALLYKKHLFSPKPSWNTAWVLEACVRFCTIKSSISVLVEFCRVLMWHLWVFTVLGWDVYMFKVISGIYQSMARSMWTVLWKMRVLWKDCLQNTLMHSHNND